MKNHLTIHHLDDEDFLIDICDNPLTCLSCSRVLKNIERILKDEFLNDRKYYNKMYRLTFRVNNSGDSILYQNFDCIEDIVFRLFQVINADRKNLHILKSYLTTNFINDEASPNPILEVQVWFFGYLSSDRVMRIQTFCYNELPLIGGIEGYIENLSYMKEYDLDALILKENPPYEKFPLLFSDDEINPYGTENLRNQMQYLYAVRIHEIDMVAVLEPNFRIRTFFR